MADAKSSYESNLISYLTSEQSYKSYNYLQKLFSSCHVLRSSCYTTNSDGDKENLFNTYFNSVFTKSNFILPSLCDLSTNTVNSTTVSIIIFEGDEQQGIS